MKIICISDTHNKHNEIIVPPGDVIIHAGDFTEAGTKSETFEFLKWFSALPHTHKILVAGNHDFYLEKHASHLENIIPQNINYLMDSGIQIENFNFWGSPFTPGEGRWAFTRTRGNEISEHWEKIPADTDFLITHTPPYKILDEIDNKQHIGCQQLSKKLKELKLPHHIFGHIHEDYGIVRTRDTTFVNASSLDAKSRQINAPLAIQCFDS